MFEDDGEVEEVPAGPRTGSAKRSNVEQAESVRGPAESVRGTDSAYSPSPTVRSRALNWSNIRPAYDDRPDKAVRPFGRSHVSEISAEANERCLPARVRIWPRVRRGSKPS